MTTETFDAIIVGTGQAGPALANRLTSAGMSVALVERHLVGGTCVNTGCTPTKTMVASAYAAHMIARAADYGVVIDGSMRVDMAKVKARVDAIVDADRAGLERWFAGMPRCTLIRGHARFTGQRELEVDGRRITASKIFLNVGGRALIPKLDGVDSVSYLTNTDMVALDAVPRHLVIVGGSYVGLEFAQMFRRFGAKVTVIEKGDRLVAREDEDVSALIHKILEGEGIEIVLGAECIKLAPHADGVAVHAGHGDEKHDIVGSHVLLAVGRRPNTDDLGLDKAGIKTNAAGYVTVDDQLRTNVEGVYALGDCNGRGAFTHTAYDDYEIVAANLLDGASRSLADRIPVYALYIDPPLGRAGMTVAQARAAGRTIRIGQRPMTRVARAKEKGEAQGLMRAVVDADTNRILGATIFGPGADEAVHTIIATMSAGATYDVLKRTMAIHPTVSELIPTILEELGAAS